MAKRYHKAQRKEDNPLSISRVYADININRLKEYWDYENYEPEFGYKIILKFTDSFIHIS